MFDEEDANKMDMLSREMEDIVRDM